MLGRSFIVMLFICCASSHPLSAAEQVLVEAESFTNFGGWKLDTQFITEMGSPYLLAHGLGTPVSDAHTTVTVPRTGKYRVFVRTKDWVARWKAPGKPGRFQVLINGQALANDVGTQGATWSWQDAGVVEVDEPTIKLALHDMTGFDGHCDAILLSSDLTY
ncbi:MAG TPA: NADH-dependent oxidoreductase, partial [Planctomycetaceae bacterium]|nr:NADH-dependent oxidoreductase [Planctomycetaceae bacterium]